MRRELVGGFLDIRMAVGVGVSKDAHELYDKLSAIQIFLFYLLFLENRQEGKSA
jgi:hypothetical protein